MDGVCLEWEREKGIGETSRKVDCKKVNNYWPQFTFLTGHTKDIQIKNFLKMSFKSNLATLLIFILNISIGWIG